MSAEIYAIMSPTNESVDLDDCLRILNMDKNRSMLATMYLNACGEQADIPMEGIWTSERVDQPGNLWVMTFTVTVGCISREVNVILWGGAKSIVIHSQLAWATMMRDRVFESGFRRFCRHIAIELGAASIIYCPGDGWPPSDNLIESFLAQGWSSKQIEDRFFSLAGPPLVDFGDAPAKNHLLGYYIVEKEGLFGEARGS